MTTATAAPAAEVDADKTFNNTRAGFALHGIEFYRLADDTFLAARWNLSRPFASLEAAAKFLRQLGGAM